MLKRLLLLLLGRSSSPASIAHLLALELLPSFLLLRFSTMQKIALQKNENFVTVQLQLFQTAHSQVLQERKDGEPEANCASIN